MKKIIVILFLCCTVQVFAQYSPVKVALNEKYYESWVYVNFNNILAKAHKVITGNSMQVYADSQMTAKLSHEEIMKKMSFDGVVKIPDDPAHPFGKDHDTVVKVLIGDFDYTDRIHVICKGDTIHSIEICVYDYYHDSKNGFKYHDFFAIRSYKPTFYIIWGDLQSMLTTEEKFALESMIKYKTNQKFGTVDIEKDDWSQLGLAMHKAVENKLFKNVVNLKLPIYVKDSLTTRGTAEYLDKYLSDIQIRYIPNDIKNPTGDYHDSAVKVYDPRYKSDADTFYSRDIHLVWNLDENSQMKLIAITPTSDQYINGQPTGRSTFGYVKTSDLGYIYSKEEIALIKYISMYTLLLHIDYNGWNSGLPSINKVREAPFGGYPSMIR